MYNIIKLDLLLFIPDLLFRLSEYQPGLTGWVEDKNQTSGVHKTVKMVMAESSACCGGDVLKMRCHAPIYEEAEESTSGSIKKAGAVVGIGCFGGGCGCVC